MNCQKIPAGQLSPSQSDAVNEYLPKHPVLTDILNTLESINLDYFFLITSAKDTIAVRTPHSLELFVDDFYDKDSLA